MEAKQTGSDAFAAIEGVLSWDDFIQSVTEAQTLAQSENFDYLHRIGDRYGQVRRYAPAFLDALRMKAAPAVRDILDAVETGDYVWHRSGGAKMRKFRPLRPFARS